MAVVWNAQSEFHEIPFLASVYRIVCVVPSLAKETAYGRNKFYTRIIRVRPAYKKFQNLILHSLRLTAQNFITVTRFDK